MKMRSRKLRHIDARDILMKYADYDFGTQDVDQIHLAAIQTNTLTPDGFYEIVSSVQLWKRWTCANSYNCL